MKKTISLIVAIIMAAAMTAGCNRNKIPDDENTIEIYAVEAGYGVDWLKESIKEFELENPQYECYLWTDVGTDRGESLLKSGPKHTTADLIFSISTYYPLQAMGAGAMRGYDNILADLTDIYNEKVPGEELTLREKMYDPFVEQGIREEENSEGVWEERFYTYPWAQSVNGIVYNSTILDMYADNVPRTTDEFLEVCDVIKTEHNFTRDVEAPIVLSLSVSYLSNLSNIFWAQYNTSEGYRNFWRGKDDGEYSEKIFEQKGRLYTLQFVEQMINPGFERAHKSISSLNYAEAQARLLSGGGVFNISADWFENEMKDIAQQSTEGYSINIMRTPIISALSDKLSYWDYLDDYEAAVNAGQTILLQDYDTKLRSLVAYIDGEGEKPDYADQETIEADLAIVAAARRVVSSNGAALQSVIPSYSNNIKGAKQFLQFLATDKGQQVFIDNTSGSATCVEYDIKADTQRYSALSDFQKVKFDIIETADVLPVYTNMEMFFKAGLTAWAYNINSSLSVPVTDKSYKSPSTIFEDSKITYNEYRRLLQNAGMI